MTAEDTIESILLEQFRDSSVEVYETEGGYLISIASSGFDGEDLAKNQQRVVKALKEEHARIGDVIYIARLFTYAREDEAFVVPATLHTIRSQRSGTMSMTTLAAGDAYVTLREIDGELLVMGDYRRRVIPAKELRSDDGRALLPFVANRFVELESGGQRHDVEEARRRISGEIEIHLA